MLVRGVVIEAAEVPPRVGGWYYAWAIFRVRVDEWGIDRGIDGSGMSAVSVWRVGDFTNRLRF